MSGDHHSFWGSSSKALSANHFSQNRFHLVEGNPAGNYVLAHFETQHLPLPSAVHVIPKHLQEEPRSSFLKWQVTKTPEGDCYLLVNALSYPELGCKDFPLDSIEKNHDPKSLKITTTPHETIDGVSLHSKSLKLTSELTPPEHYRQVLSAYLVFLQSLYYPNPVIREDRSLELQSLRQHIQALFDNYRVVKDHDFAKTLELIKNSCFDLEWFKTEENEDDLRLAPEGWSGGSLEIIGTNEHDGNYKSIIPFNKRTLIHDVKELRADARMIRLGVKVDESQMLHYLDHLSKLESPHQPSEAHNGNIWVPKGSAEKLAQQVRSMMNWKLDWEMLNNTMLVEEHEGPP